MNNEQLSAALSAYVDPYLGATLHEAGAIKTLEAADGAVRLNVELGFPCGGYRDELANTLRELLLNQPGVERAEVDVQWRVTSHSVQHGLAPVPNIRNIIAVASGKGGVGKSTVSVNLALALAADGASVGILDADIYGPSQPRMLGIEQRASSKDQKTIEPMSAHGVSAMSIGFLVDTDQAMIWRGPMVTQALQQLLTETNWPELDYLIIDLPPGTGDIQLTLSQKIPVSGAVIVTTPQDIALLDARRGLKMFEKVNVPVLGVVENMSTHVCSQCGHEEAIFGAGGGEQLAAAEGIDLLGKLPLDIRIREQADGGAPTVVADPESDIAIRYKDIGRSVVARLSLSARDFSAKFPKIVVE